MRVVYVSKALTVAAYREKIRELAEHVDVTAVIPERWSGDEPEPSPGGAPDPLRVPVRFSGRNHLHHYPGAGRWLDRLEPDLVHVDEEPYSAVTWQLGRLCRARGVPYLFFGWQNIDRRLPPPFGRLRAAVFRGSRAAIAGTRTAAAVLRRAGYRGPLRVIPQFGVDPDHFTPCPEAGRRMRARLGIPGHGYVIGYGGRLVPEKGVFTLLDAFASLQSGHDDPAYLVVIGDGPSRAKLESEAGKRGLSSRVRFLGRVRSLQMPDPIRACDLMTLPTVGTATWTEQFGRILVEAMACGVPVVGSRCGEIPAVIGDVGELVPSGDARALAAALERLRRDPDLRSRRSTRGRERALERFTHRRVARETAAFYRDLEGVREVAS